MNVNATASPLRAVSGGRQSQGSPPGRWASCVSAILSPLRPKSCDPEGNTVRKQSGSTHLRPHSEPPRGKPSLCTSPPREVTREYSVGTQHGLQPTYHVRPLQSGPYNGSPPHSQHVGSSRIPFHAAGVAPGNFVPGGPANACQIVQRDSSSRPTPQGTSTGSPPLYSRGGDYRTPSPYYVPTSQQLHPRQPMMMDTSPARRSSHSPPSARSSTASPRSSRSQATGRTTGTGGGAARSTGHNTAASPCLGPTRV